MMKKLLLLFAACLLASAPSFAVNPNESSFHLYGGVVFPVVAEYDRTVWFVRNSTTNETSRVDCFPAETYGCSSIMQGHWLVIDGYLAGEGLCGDKPCNILRATAVKVWNSTTNTWTSVTTPPPTP